MKDNIIKNTYVSAFDVNDRALKELIIINTKALVDDNTQRCVLLDYNRIKDELIYYKFYGDTLSQNVIFNIFLPVVLANTNIQKSEEEIIEVTKRYVKYLKKDSQLFDYIIGSVMYNCLIHTLIDNQSIEYEELLNTIKERIIGFTLELDKINTIKFQMMRINVMQSIDKYIDAKPNEYENDIVSNLLSIIYDIYIEDRSIEDDGINSIKKSILSILGSKEEHNIDNIDFINSMSEYIVKLRKYKINKKRYTQKSDPRYLINLNEGDSQLDPILNQITVISKKFNNQVLNVVVKAKSGLYTFTFKRS